MVLRASAGSLLVHDIASSIATDVIGQVRTFGSSERFTLGDQLIRARCPCPLILPKDVAVAQSRTFVASCSMRAALHRKCYRSCRLRGDPGWAAAKRSSPSKTEARSFSR